MERSYRKLALAISINAALMYFLTYINLWEPDHFANNLNRLYMALAMAAPMIVIMLVVMSGMFEDRKRNAAAYAVAVALFAGALLLTRAQAPIGNEQFLRSMIPHHSSAVLMCERADITDPEIEQLCDTIVRTQLEEIAQMQEIRERY